MKIRRTTTYAVHCLSIYTLLPHWLRLLQVRTSFPDLSGYFCVFFRLSERSVTYHLMACNGRVLRTTTLNLSLGSCSFPFSRMLSRIRVPRDRVLRYLINCSCCLTVGSPAYYALKEKGKLPTGPPVIDARSVTPGSQPNTKTGKGKKKSTANGAASNANNTPASSVWGINLGESVKNGGDSGSSDPWATVTKANGKVSAAPTYSSKGWGDMQANRSRKAPASTGKFIPFSSLATSSNRFMLQRAPHHLPVCISQAFLSQL